MYTCSIRMDSASQTLGSWWLECSWSKSRSEEKRGLFSLFPCTRGGVGVKYQFQDKEYTVMTKEAYDHLQDLLERSKQNLELLSSIVQWSLRVLSVHLTHIM